LDYHGCMFAKRGWILALPVLVVALQASTTSSNGQTTVGFRSDGPNCLAPGAPFQGERTTKTVRRLQDGSSLAYEAHELMGRDADGRFIDESYRTGAGAQAEERFFVLGDPVAKREVSWTKGAKSGYSHPLSPATHMTISALAPNAREEAVQFPKDKATATTENLGTRTVSGVVATGTRTVTILPAGKNGNDRPLQSSQEVWIANDLQIVVAETDSSSITGTRTVEMLSLERIAPPASRFVVPADLAIKDLPGMGGVLGGIFGDRETPAYWKALADIAKPETAEKAATDLIAYARVHDEVANHVAHVLASRKMHLEEADALGRASVERFERETATIELDRATLRDLHRMDDLAEYWDTLGMVRWAQGDEESAKRYCRIAWNLGGEGLYMADLARFALKDGDTELAQRMLRVALGGTADDREKGQIASDFAKLSPEKPTPIDDPPSVVLTNPLPMQGAAEFWLLFAGNAPPQVRWAGGDDRLALQGPAIAAAKYSPQMPDEGPERVLRRAHLVCQETSCKLTLLYSYRAIPKPGPKTPIPAK
jgi:hypothetical protein